MLHSSKIEKWERNFLNTVLLFYFKKWGKNLLRKITPFSFHFPFRFHQNQRANLFSETMQLCEKVLKYTNELQFSLFRSPPA